MTKPHFEYRYNLEAIFTFIRCCCIDSDVPVAQLLEVSVYLLAQGNFLRLFCYWVRLPMQKRSHLNAP